MFSFIWYLPNLKKHPMWARYAIEARECPCIFVSFLFSNYLIRGVSQKIVDTFWNPKIWHRRFKIKSYLQKVTPSEFSLKIAWFMSCIHIYHWGLGTAEHFGNISWRQSAGVIVKHRFKWMGKHFFFFCFVLFGVELAPCFLVTFISFLATFLYNLYCTYLIEFRWFLKSVIFSVAHLAREQAASEWLCVKSNKK